MSASERRETLRRAFEAGEASFRGGYGITGNNPYKAAASRDAWEAGWRNAAGHGPASQSEPAPQPESPRAAFLKQSSSHRAMTANHRSPWNKIPAEETRIAEDEKRRKEVAA